MALNPRQVITEAAVLAPARTRAAPKTFSTTTASTRHLMPAAPYALRGGYQKYLRARS